MKVECQFMNVAEPLFFYGVDYGKKLIPNHSKGRLKLEYDNETKEATITNIKGQYTRITESWIFSYEPIQEKAMEVKNLHHDQRLTATVKAQIGGPNEVFQAQVETPVSKVQQRKGRAPKFQGEESQGE